jgi:excinuclease ABC subunit A
MKYHAVCEGLRLKKEAQFFKIDEQNTELCAMDIDLTAWFHDLDSRLSDKQTYRYRSN